MDYNDISIRLKRTLSSLNGRFDENILVGVHIDYGKNDHSHWMSMTVGNDDEETILNKIFIILHNLASLKDHLKNCLKTKGYNPKVVESEIDNSLHLQVLIDIVNQEKHGYPLTKSNRSGKNPILKMPMQVLRVTSSAESNSVASFSFNSDGSLNMQGQGAIAIRAIIFDGNNIPIFGLDELVETCFEKWKALTSIYNC